MSRTPTPSFYYGERDSDTSGSSRPIDFRPPFAMGATMSASLLAPFPRPLLAQAYGTPGSSHGQSPVPRSLTNYQGIPMFEESEPSRPRATTRGRGRAARARPSGRAARQESELASSDIRDDSGPAERRQRRAPYRVCLGYWGDHPEDIPDMTCPYDVSMRAPSMTLPPFYNLSNESMSLEEYNFDQYVKMVEKSACSIDYLGYTVDYSSLFEQTTAMLETIVQVTFETLVRRSRQTDPVGMIHELYDMWSMSFRFIDRPGDDPLPQDLVSLPRTANEVITRCLACVDCYKIIFTVLSHRYKQERSIYQSEKQLILYHCNEIIPRMHLVCRGFACFSQATTLGFEGNVSVERVAHEYGLRLPFLNGIELPIDFNMQSRDIMGRFDPMRNSYQYFFRYILQVAEINKLRMHGNMLYTEHVIFDDSHADGKIHTRFWKPYMDVKKFIYHSVQPIGQEHVFRAVIANRQSGIDQIAKQLVESQFIKGINPDFRYRSFRNGLYYMEVDLEREPLLSWNDPARLNGRFIPYSSPLCPTNIASETFFNTNFDEAWLYCPVEAIDTSYLDTLLRTYNIHIDSVIDRDLEQGAFGEAVVSRLDGSTGSVASEGLARISYLQNLLGESIVMNAEEPEWKYSMSFVYAMAVFLCGRCLRPLYTKIVNHLGETYRMTDNYQCAPFFVGNPGTGKSTLLNLIAKMYHRTSTFELKCNSDSQFGLGQLNDENIKFSYMTETSRTMPWNVSVLNGMVEGGFTEFRGFHKEPVTDVVRFTMAFAANPDQVPYDWIKDPRQGFRRRLAVFQFNVSPQKSDSEFFNKLQQEDELAKMLVKFNRMYLLGRAYFDSVRLVNGSFNFVEYINKHLYFSSVRADLFALASPVDSFFSQENSEMLVLDPANIKAYLLSDVMRALKEFCQARYVPPYRMPSQQALILALQTYYCKIIKGVVGAEEIASVPKGVEAVTKKGEQSYLDFVQGIHIKAPGYFAFSPQAKQTNYSAGSSLSFAKRGRKRGRGEGVINHDVLFSQLESEMTNLLDEVEGSVHQGASNPSE